VTAADLLPADAYLGHKTNLEQKAVRARTTVQRESVARAFAEYERYLASAYTAEASGSATWVTSAVAAVEAYLDFAKSLERLDPLFNWRSDYAGSVLPEFLIRFTFTKLVRGGLTPLLSTRDSVVELTLTGASAGPGWTIRRKNQDMSVGLERLEITGDEGDVAFLVPLVVAEVKTNLDINKLSGLNFSAESLKRSFPLARYLIVTETVDFSLADNYVAGSVDEIYVLRRVMRTKHRRQPVPLKADVFETFFEDVTATVAAAGTPRGHVYSRLQTGKLING
jgi:hypothetical protein